jgi:drug/metabolite transporter (DMT)-like permease
VTNAAIINSLTAPLTAFASSFINRERLARNFWAFCGVMFAGAAMVSLKGGLSGINYGDIAVFGSSLSFAIGSPYANRAMRHRPHYEVILGRLAIGCALLLPPALLYFNLWGIVSDLAILAPTIMSALFFTANLLCFYEVVEWEGVAFASQIALVNPVIVFVIDYLFFGTAPTALSIAGGVVVLASAYMMVRDRMSAAGQAGK